MQSGAVAYVRQQERRGLGHAVWCARRLIGDEPFAVMLPDDVIDAETPCLQQMIEAYAEIGGNMVATMEVPRDERLVLRHPRRRRRRPARRCRCAAWSRSPSAEVAPSNMAVIGRYILTPQVLRNLEDVEAGAGGEIQLTDAIAAEIAARRQRLRLPLQGPPLRLRLEVGLPAGDRRLRPGPRPSCATSSSTSCAPFTAFETAARGRRLAAARLTGQRRATRTRLAPGVQPCRTATR